MPFQGAYKKQMGLVRGKGPSIKEISREREGECVNRNPDRRKGGCVNLVIKN